MESKADFCLFVDDLMVNGRDFFPFFFKLFFLSWAIAWSTGFLFLKTFFLL